MQTPSRRPSLPVQPSPDRQSQDHQSPAALPAPALPALARPALAAAPTAGPMKAMSPGVVDYLFRQLVTGESPEDLSWQKEGISLAAQPPGAELARRLAETDLEALTPLELFHYVRAAQRLATWAEGLREAAVEKYCGTDGNTGVAVPGAGADHRLPRTEGTVS